MQGISDAPDDLDSGIQLVGWSSANLRQGIQRPM